MRLESSETLVRLGRYLFKTRNVLFPLVYVPAVLLTEPRPFMGDRGMDWILDAVGFTMALAGQALRALVIGLAYIHRGGKNRQVYADSLVQEGIFAHCRNPLYAGNLLIAMGFFIVHNNPWAYAIGLSFFIVAYLSIVAAEERYLHERFGAVYGDYCRRVPRFGLRLRGLGATVGSMEFQWRRVLRKEYGTFFMTATIALALIVRERLAWREWEANRTMMVVTSALFALLVMAWIAARFLKKRGMLRSSHE
jgi:protein-S-isoprenylcysteine O-methyltransferase Ste14